MITKNDVIKAEYTGPKCKHPLHVEDSSGRPVMSVDNKGILTTYDKDGNAYVHEAKRKVSLISFFIKNDQIHH